MNIIFLMTGLFSESTSNGFLIDSSSPVVLQRPFLSSDLGSVVDSSLVLRSTMKIRWDVEDRQSFIQRQYISLSTHNGGKFNSTSTKVRL
jgi:hypothetical protein